jgi:hypothetical protein
MGSSLHRGPVGEPGGDLSTGPFERKRKWISGVLFSELRTLKVTSGGHMELN